jgi:hypothetical protein
MTTLIIDIAEDPTPKLAALKASGVRAIFGYLSSINPTGDKCWTPARMHAIAAAGLRAGLVHEGWGGVGGRGISAGDGARDGRYCRSAAVALGAPRGACVYFACDWDFSATQIQASVIPYFKAVRTAFADGFYRVGVYGSGTVCAAVAAAGLADLTWEAQSRGWLGYSAWLAKASMLQGPETKILGLDIDSDTAPGDVGDFVPFAQAEKTSAPTPSSSQYAAAAAATFKVLKADVDAKVPAFFRGEISDAMLQSLANNAAKAAVDAAVRASVIPPQPKETASS